MRNKIIILFILCVIKNVGSQALQLQQFPDPVDSLTDETVIMLLDDTRHEQINSQNYIHVILTTGVKKNLFRDLLQMQDEITNALQQVHQWIDDFDIRDERILKLYRLILETKFYQDKLINKIK